MAYRDLTTEQFELVKDASAKVCEQNNLKTVGDFKRIGNELIDALKIGVITYKDLLCPVIDFNPKELT